MKKRSLYIAILGMSVLSVQAEKPVQAENFASPLECARLDVAFSNKTHSGASFTWRTETSAADSPAVTPRAIAIWGDSLTSSRDFIDAALNASGMSKDTVQPSFIQAGMKVPGLRLPLEVGCASKGWQVAYVHKEQRNQAGFSKGFLSLNSKNTGETISLDFWFPLLSTRVKQLTLVYEKPKPDGSLLLAVSVDDGNESFISLSKKSGSALHIRPGSPMAAMESS